MRLALMLTIFAVVGSIAAVGTTRAQDGILSISTVEEGTTTTIGDSTVTIPPDVTVVTPWTSCRSGYRTRYVSDNLERKRCDKPVAWIKRMIWRTYHRNNRCRSWFSVDRYESPYFGHGTPFTKTEQRKRLNILRVKRHHNCIERWSIVNKSFERSVYVTANLFGTSASWLLACADDEGGRGAWVPNKDDSGAGGWLQFMYSTYVRMASTGFSELHHRDIPVPNTFNSWYSPLGQAIAGAWGFVNGRSTEWSGASC